MRRLPELDDAALVFGTLLDRAAETVSGLADMPVLGCPREVAGVGCKSATLTILSAANAGVFLERFEPGTPDSL